MKAWKIDKLDLCCVPEERRVALKSLQCDRRPALSFCSIRVSFGIKETLRLPELIFWNMKTSAYGWRQQQAKKSISLMEHSKRGDIHIYIVLLAQCCLGQCFLWYLLLVSTHFCVYTCRSPMSLLLFFLWNTKGKNRKHFQAIKHQQNTVPHTKLSHGFKRQRNADYFLKLELWQNHIGLLEKHASTYVSCKEKGLIQTIVFCSLKYRPTV